TRASKQLRKLGRVR
ncbi:unnamed protein product, partial [Oikopleura dioica]